MTDDMDDDRLDALLAAYRAAEPGAALRERIIGAAPRQRSVGRAWRWLGGAGIGAVLAGSCAAGIAAGLMLAPASVTRLIGGAPAPAPAEISSLVDPDDGLTSG